MICEDKVKGVDNNFADFPLRIFDSLFEKRQHSLQSRRLRFDDCICSLELIRLNGLDFRDGESDGWRLIVEPIEILFEGSSASTG